MCKPHKRRGAGRSAKDPISAKRRIGYTRRYSRRTVERDCRSSGTPSTPSIRHSDVLTWSGCMVARGHMRVNYLPTHQFPALGRRIIALIAYVCLRPSIPAH